MKLQQKINNIILKRFMTILCIVFLLFILYWFHINIPCIFHKITGFYCPGCGITRSLYHLVTLNIYQSFRYNPLLFVLYPILIPYFFYKVYIWLFNKNDNITKKVPNSIWITLIIILLLYGVIRNIDIFDFLAPTKI